jgi:hypothetical protein
MTTELELKNLALGTYIGTERLTTLTDDVPARYALDAVYPGVVGLILKRGIWKHALRTVALTKEVTAPTFHRQHAYAKPTDFVRIARISPDIRLDVELLHYREDGDFFYSDVDPIYLQYVSNDAAWGLDLTRWPEAFTDAVAAELAYKSLLPISKDRGDRADLYKIKAQALDLSRRQDAVDEPVKSVPAGRLVRSRTGYGSMNGTLRGLGRW